MKSKDALNHGEIAKVCFYGKLTYL